MTISTILIDKCLNQERQAQKELYMQLLPYLKAVGIRYLKNRSLINDVLQEAFIRIFKKIEQFDKEKGDFLKWSTRITINAALSYNERVHFDSYEFDVHLHDTGHTPEILKVFSNEMVLEFLRKMPFELYEVFNLFIIDGYSHTEISTSLEISSALSRKRLSRAREWLKCNTHSVDKEAISN